MSDEVTDGQKFALNKLVDAVAKGDRNMRLYILSKLIGREVGSSAQVRLDEWRKVRNTATPAWSDNDWTVADSFTRRLGALANEYREQVLGQERLF